LQGAGGSDDIETCVESERHRVPLFETQIRDVMVFLPGDREEGLVAIDAERLA